jgi:hypothetical protein
MKNLTENQTNLVNKMVSEFERLNAEKPKVEVQSSAIDLLFNKANDYHTDKSDFYEDIRDSNKVIKNLSYDAMAVFTSQIKELFKDYNIRFLESQNCVQFVTKNSSDKDYICKSFRVNYYVKYQKFDEKSNTETKFTGFYIYYDNAPINYKNFLECPIFLKVIEDMFLEYPQIKKINN